MGIRSSEWGFGQKQRYAKSEGMSRQNDSKMIAYDDTKSNEINQELF
jgi:hypothetical protein